MSMTVSNSIGREFTKILNFPLNLIGEASEEFPTSPLYPMNLSEARIAYNFKKDIIHIRHLHDHIIQKHNVLKIKGE